MARLPKQGLDYFPLDVDFESDPKLRKLVRAHGSEGILVYIEFLCIVYKNGYYVESDLESLAEDIWYRINLKCGEFDTEAVLAILKMMVDLNIIDIKNLFEHKVITSRAVQKQFLACTMRRKKQERPYWILTPEDEECIRGIYVNKNGINVDINNDNESNDETRINVNNNLINVDNNSINADNNSIDVCKSTQSKSKRKKKEDKEDKYDKRNVPFHLSYYTKCLIDDHLISVYDIDLYKFEQLFQDAIRDYEFELLQRVFRYTRDYVRKHKHEIVDLYAYFEKAFNKNLNHMDGYEERLEKWYENMDKWLAELKNDEKT